MPKTRYFYDDAPEHGITAAQMKRLGRAKQVACMLNWFGRNFEDPAEETPYQSAEGGYQYINGGPYDAREALDDEFSSFVSEAAIEEAVGEIESGGLTDWAPGPEHPNNQREDEDYPQDDEEPPPPPDLDDLIRQLEAGARTEFGSPYEQGERQELLRRLDRIEVLLLAALPPAHGGIGHNRYEAEADDRPDPQLVCDALGASAKIRAELQKPAPDALVVAKETSFLKKLATGIVIAAVGGVIGHVVGQIVDRHPELSVAVEAVVTQAVHWISVVVVPPF